MKFLIFFAFLLMAMQQLVDTRAAFKTESESTPSTETIESWKENYPWLSFNTAKNKVTCTICTNAIEKKLPVPTDILSQISRKTFVTAGFDMWKNAFKAFGDHETSALHQISASLLDNLNHIKNGIENILQQPQGFFPNF